MIKVADYEEVTVIKMGRTIAGKLLYPVHSFFWKGILVDTGCYSCRREFSKAIQEFPVSKVLLTHAHEDHFGNVWYFNRQQIPVLSDKKAIPYIEDPRRLGMELYREITWGTPPAGEAQELLPEIKLGNLTLQVVATPGHSPDHVVFFEPTREYLFTGDLFLGTRQRLFMRQEKFWESLNSLKSALALKPRVLFCGLNGVILGGQQKLAEKISFWEDLAAKVLALYEKGVTPREITQKLFPGKNLLAVLTGGSFSSLNLVKSILDR